MHWKKGNRGSNEVTGFLDQGAFFEGHLEFSGTLRIDGSVKGTIQTNDHLIVGENGILEVEIHAGTVSISGKVMGVIYAKDRVVIHPKGRVSGEVHSPALVIEQGALFDGRTFMTQDKAEPISIERVDRNTSQIG